MLYGYLPAVVTGFLLTAIPNWTGRLPIQGMPLLALAVVWLVGRVAVTFSAEIGWLLAAIVDVSFLVLVVAAREIIVGSNWRNLRVVGLVTLLLSGNIAFHLEAHFQGSAEYGARIGITAVVLLLVVIGGSAHDMKPNRQVARLQRSKPSTRYGFDGRPRISTDARYVWHRFLNSSRMNKTS